MGLDWKTKRKITTTLCIALQCLYTFEYTATAISAIYYYQNSFEVADPKFFYGCSVAAIYASAVMSSFICGRWMDRTRDLRRIVLTLLLFNIVGNLIYTLNWSQWIPVLGRFLCGINAAASTAATGV